MRTSRILRHSTAAVSAVAAVFAVTGLTTPAHASGSFYVSPSGSDSARGTSSSPFKTIKDGLAHLKSGDTLHLEAGTYAGFSTTPVAGTSLVGDNGAVVKGLVRISKAKDFTWDNVDVTWLPGTSSKEHMMRWTGGSGWTLKNSEIYGAHSYADLHITGAPSDWLVTGNYIHDTYKSNSTNQDHLIYFANGTAGGTIEHNILAHSPNGRGIKVGSAGSAKTENVTIRYNTFLDNTGPSNIQLSYYTSDVQIYRNIMVKSSKQNITAFNLAGSGNVAHDNIGFGSSGVVDTSDAGLKDTGQNVTHDPKLDSSFHPQDGASQAYGRFSN